MADGIRVTIRGDREVIRALERLPAQATREVKDGSERIARDLANEIRRVGRSQGRQTARAAATVRISRQTFPTIVAGPERRLFGSEFGVKRRFGWYARRRYFHSPARQYKPHRGSASYWFFATQDANRGRIAAAHRDMADAVVRRWSA